mmetsp:Transcript_34224/g.41930  ORF Transcript_34224/g.41930 Transcript_34224/m.41930 type:complete len:118 (-) Transcript_34224:278-631(-)|eukprot:CAMPEP_0172498322 /NCGR_PEP_ID=MMETSP1066-20121228/112163_1 /TAXON_ID=671091 /ORGANISM="Coscinodiscus wailesii, Strain CCMP2513" /LENGTH=117 /DNA_ID=CAMNT_0013271553 /DNA_START=132 /DNA_END=485 /DNA_ORIENTATION=+
MAKTKKNDDYEIPIAEVVSNDPIEDPVDPAQNVEPSAPPQPQNTNYISQTGGKSVLDRNPFMILFHAIFLLGIIWPLSFVSAILWIFMKPFELCCGKYVSSFFERSTKKITDMLVGD